MNFNTQVCTTKEQSERLLALGLKKETADMWLTNCFVGRNGTPMIFVDDTWNPSTGKYSESDIPAWSLHRLIAMCPPCIIDVHPPLHLTITDRGVFYTEEHFKEEYEQTFSEHRSLYDNIIDCISWMIEEGYFDKKYLEPQ